VHLIGTIFCRLTLYVVLHILIVIVTFYDHLRVKSRIHNHSSLTLVKSEEVLYVNRESFDIICKSKYRSGQIRCLYSCLTAIFLHSLNLIQ